MPSVECTLSVRLAVCTLADLYESFAGCQSQLEDTLYHDFAEETTRQLLRPGLRLRIQSFILRLERDEFALVPTPCVSSSFFEQKCLHPPLDRTGVPVKANVCRSGATVAKVGDNLRKETPSRMPEASCGR